MAKASLREGWAMAEAAEEISEDEIDREIGEVRLARALEKAR